MIADYVIVRELEETMSILSKYNGKARVLAGGTDSFSQFVQSRKKIVVVDISNSKDLNYISFDDKGVEIGAAVTLSHLLKTVQLVQKVPALVEAISQVGSPQIRNQGTLVGNILTGRAVANGRMCAASLGAFLKVRSPDRERNIGIDKLDERGYKLRNNEIAVSLVILTNKSVKASAYKCFTPRKGFSYASACVSASVTLDAEGDFVTVNLLASPILPSSAKSRMKPCNSCAGSCRLCRVVRLSQLEQNLVGHPAREEEIENAFNMFDWESLPIRDSLINGTSDYRRDLLKILSKRALASALYRHQQISQT